MRDRERAQKGLKERERARKGLKETERESTKKD